MSKEKNKKKGIATVLALATILVVGGLSAYLVDSDNVSNNIQLQAAQRNEIIHRLYGFNTGTRIDTLTQANEDYSKEVTNSSGNQIQIDDEDVFVINNVPVVKGTFKIPTAVGAVASGEDDTAIIFDTTYVDFFHNQEFYVNYNWGHVSQTKVNNEDTYVCDLHGCFLNSYTLKTPVEGSENKFENTRKFYDSPGSASAPTDEADDSYDQYAGIYQRYNVGETDINKAFKEIPVGTKAHGSAAQYEESYTEGTDIEQQATAQTYYFDYVPIDYSIEYWLDPDYDSASVVKGNQPANDPRNPKSYTVLSECQFYEPIWPGHIFLGWRVVSDTNPDDNGEPKNYQNSTTVEYITGINTASALGSQKNYDEAQIDASSYDRLKETLSKRSTGNLILEAEWATIIKVNYHLGKVSGDYYQNGTNSATNSIAPLSLNRAGIFANGLNDVMNVPLNLGETEDDDKVNSVVYEWVTNEEGRDGHFQVVENGGNYLEPKIDGHPYVAYWLTENPSVAGTTSVEENSVFSMSLNPERNENSLDTTVYTTDRPTIDFNTLYNSGKLQIAPDKSAYVLDVYAYVRPVLTLTAKADDTPDTDNYDYKGTETKTYTYLGDGDRLGNEHPFEFITSYDIKNWHYDPRMIGKAADQGGNGYQVPSKFAKAGSGAADYSFVGWFSEKDKTFTNEDYETDDSYLGKYIEKLSGNTQNTKTETFVQHVLSESTEIYKPDYSTIIYAGWKERASEDYKFRFDVGFYHETGQNTPQQLSNDDLSDGSPNMSEILIVPKGTTGDLPACRFVIDDKIYDYWSVQTDSENGNPVYTKVETFEELAELVEEDNKNVDSNGEYAGYIKNAAGEITLYANWRDTGFIIYFDANNVEPIDLYSDSNHYENADTAAAPIFSSVNKRVRTIINPDTPTLIQTLVTNSNLTYATSMGALYNHYYDYDTVLDSNGTIKYNADRERTADKKKVYLYTLTDESDHQITGYAEESNRKATGKEWYICNIEGEEEYYYFHFTEGTKPKNKDRWSGTIQLENVYEFTGSLEKQRIDIDGKKYHWEIDHYGDYKFAGWNTKPDGTGTTYFNTSDIEGKDGEAIVLYAMWQRWQITYNAGKVGDDEGYFTTGVNSLPITYYHGNDAKFIGSGFTYRIPRVKTLGVQFDYWMNNDSLKSDSSNAIRNEYIDPLTGELSQGMPLFGYDDITSSLHINVDAHYKTNVIVPIYFDPNGGTGSITSIQIPRNGKTKLSTNARMIATGKVTSKAMDELTNSDTRVYPKQGFYNVDKNGNELPFDHWEVRDSEGNPVLDIYDGEIVDDIKIADALQRAGEKNCQPAAIVLYAVWDTPKYRITYRSNADKNIGNIKGENKTVVYDLETHTVGDEFKILNCTGDVVTDETGNTITMDYSSDGVWQFVGWNTDPDGMGEWYAVEGSDLAKKDVPTAVVNEGKSGTLILYAMWSKYSVGFDANGADAFFELPDGTNAGNHLVVNYAWAAPVQVAVSSGSAYNGTNPYVMPKWYGHKFLGWEFRGEAAAASRNNKVIDDVNGYITSASWNWDRTGDGTRLKFNEANDTNLWNTWGIRAKWQGPFNGVIINFDLNGGAEFNSGSDRAIFITNETTGSGIYGSEYKIVDPTTTTTETDEYENVTVIKSSPYITYNDGYQFLGWKLKDANGNFISDTIYTMDAIKENPDFADYFEGKETLDSIVDSADTFDKDRTTGSGPITVTAVAQWKASDYTLTYHPNGGIGEDISEIKPVGEDVTLKPANTYSHPDRLKFLGWSKSAEPWDETDSIIKTVYDAESVQQFGGTTDLYAQWYYYYEDFEDYTTGYNAPSKWDTSYASLYSDNSNYLKMSFTAGNPGGTRSTKSQFQLDKNMLPNNYEIAFKMQLRAGSDRDDNTFYITSNVNSPDSGYILKLTRGKNGDTWTVNDVASNTVTIPNSDSDWVDVKVSIDRNAQTAVWTIGNNPSGTATIKGDGLVDGIYVKLDRYIPLFAIDDIKVYSTTGTTITFDGNGATSGSMTEQYIAPGETTKLTKNTFSRGNIQFLGWVDADSNEYDDEAEITGAEYGTTIALKAKWEAVPYTLTYYANDSSNKSVDADPQPNEGEETTLKGRHTFTNADDSNLLLLGWSKSPTPWKETASDQRKVYAPSEVVTFGRDDIGDDQTVKLYAVWYYVYEDYSDKVASKDHVKLNVQGGISETAENSYLHLEMSSGDGDRYTTGTFSYIDDITIGNSYIVEADVQIKVSELNSSTFALVTNITNNNAGISSQYLLKLKNDSKTQNFAVNDTNTSTRVKLEDNQFYNLKVVVNNNNATAYIDNEQVGTVTLNDGEKIKGFYALLGREQSKNYGHGKINIDNIKVYVANTYTVTLNNGLSDDEADSMSFDFTGSSPTYKIANPSFTNGTKELVYWQGSDGKVYFTDETITLTDDLELTAVWGTENDSGTRNNFAGYTKENNMTTNSKNEQTLIFAPNVSKTDENNRIFKSRYLNNDKISFTDDNGLKMTTDKNNAARTAYYYLDKAGSPVNYNNYEFEADFQICSKSTDSRSVAKIALITNLANANDSNNNLVSSGYLFMLQTTGASPTKFSVDGDSKNTEIIINEDDIVNVKARIINRKDVFLTITNQTTDEVYNIRTTANPGSSDEKVYGLFFTPSYGGYTTVNNIKLTQLITDTESTSGTNNALPKPKTLTLVEESMAITTEEAVLASTDENSTTTTANAETTTTTVSRNDDSTTETTTSNSTIESETTTITTIVSNAETLETTTTSGTQTTEIPITETEVTTTAVTTTIPQTVSIETTTAETTTTTVTTSEPPETTSDITELTDSEDIG